MVNHEQEFDEVLLTSINLTLSKTEGLKECQVQSVSRTASIRYLENLFEMDIKETLNNIFD